MAELNVVFLHGWSVTHTDTYGGLPEQLAALSPIAGRTVNLHEIRLGRYVSFHDEVQVMDLSRALESAIRTELGAKIDAGERFTMITHSTGGPVAREWWLRYYARVTGTPCPMSHLVMLAPANFGSALAQLGKSKVGRLKSWFENIEPGQGVLDWLELGSPEAWQLNDSWIRGRFTQDTKSPVFPFVLTAQSIDRAFYDHVNSYTGELGSDGVVRAAAANLNASLVRLRQLPTAVSTETPSVPLVVRPNRVLSAPLTPFRLIAGAAHSGKSMGIMRSVSSTATDVVPEVVTCIRRCLAVDSPSAYDSLAAEFVLETEAVADQEQCEVEEIKLFPDRRYIHDPMSMLIFRVTDSEGRAVTDFDLVLTGPENDPNRLPTGFFADRQGNRRARNTVTYFVNYALLTGSTPVIPPTGGPAWRDQQDGIPVLGLRVTGRPSDGFAHYLPAQFEATAQLFRTAIKPHQTTMIDIVLQRVVHTGVAQFDRGDDSRHSFKNQQPGPIIPEVDGEES